MKLSDLPRPRAETLMYAFVIFIGIVCLLGLVSLLVYAMFNSFLALIGIPVVALIVYVLASFIEADQED